MLLQAALLLLSLVGVVSYPVGGLRELASRNRRLEGSRPRRLNFLRKAMAAAEGELTLISPAESLKSALTLAVLSPLLWVDNDAEAEAAAIERTEGRPVCVLGSAGKTGQLIVNSLARRRIPVRAGTRSGRPFPLAPNLDPRKVQFLPADVRDFRQIQKAVAGCSAVIFAASQSTYGGKAADVDHLGAANAASACLGAEVDKLVLLSSVLVTQPESPTYRVTNLFAGNDIMGEKLRGENAVRSAYLSSDKKDRCGYVILRPGDLVDSPAEGPAALEINQGDKVFGQISRQDTAELSIASALSPAARYVTFEAFARRSKKGTPAPTGLERYGRSYSELVNGLRRDPSSPLLLRPQEPAERRREPQTNNLALASVQPPSGTAFPPMG